MAEVRYAQPDMTLMRKAYARWAPVYDLVYDGITAPARRDAVDAALSCGRDILEVGVGTGLSLGDYPVNARITGVDLSAHMLKRAVEKARKNHWSHVKLLAVMDACRLGFADATFDAVVAQFLITLVPHPEAALDEMLRVLRPGGEIVLANHFGVPDGPVARVEEAVAPLASRLGWSSAFKARRIEDWAKARGDVELLSLTPAFPLGFFKVLRLRKKA
ncbi:MULTISPECIES: methyltransferase domain-containing protein [unclassified Chelatococcus]|uniref:class I SAM-dependent methyltransferase n=1 Tax=unclassified Chelatococcus TaxID=2638111 RepID=UPI001BD0ED9E|nr:MULTISPECIES: methyltransferase domain-containing protein [unclassified Chelatococcus]MBS7696546.1 methyltransferase domain-containing protein [Chelatococcus sp. YT9]MBX3555111.1 methyltransferase domain-containing protein [Chelatococcus sp.]